MKLKNKTHYLCLIRMTTQVYLFIYYRETDRKMLNLNKEK